jgi:hypothetical protein
MTRAALFLSLIALALPAVAKSPETTLTINVTDLKGAPVDRASVIVRFVSGHSVVKMGIASKKQYELKTNQEGVAKFPPLPEGKVRVQIIDRRYQTYGDTIDISGNEKILDVHLNPPQTQYSAHE